MFTVTSRSGTSAVRPATMRIKVGDWLGIQTSTPLSPTSAVQFIGSIAVCAR